MKHLKIYKFYILIFFFISIILFIIYLPQKFKEKKNIKIKRYLNSEFVNIDTLLKENKIDIAFNKALKLYNKYPDHADSICSILGDLYNIMNDLKRSEWYYREAIKIDSEEVFYYIKLSQFYRFRKKLQSSYKVLKACLNIAPLNPLLHNELAEFYYENNDISNAIIYWEKVYEYNKDIDILLRIGNILYKENNERYKEYFNKYIKKGGKIKKIDRILHD